MSLPSNRCLLAAPDKFRGSLAAREVAAAMAEGAAGAGWTARCLPLADGGEGTLDALGGPNRTTVVTGPLGAPVEAPWRLEHGLAVVETARAAGLALAGGAGGNDALRATTRGVGELIAAALDAGAERIVVGVGGSATTDGGWGAVEVLRERVPLRAAITVACDVETRFVDAADVFSPQKGATADQVPVLRHRLAVLEERYANEFGVSVGELVGGGAAGGLAGGLAALGADCAPGFEIVADRVALDHAIAAADLVVTGEGMLDETSFAGKVVGGVAQRASTHGVPVVAIAGELDPAVARRLEAYSLLERFGVERAWDAAADCVARLLAEKLAERA
jgi:glycerate 2-kinase